MNLLRSSDFIPLLSDPGSFRTAVEGRGGGWVVIDEIQKLPSLLDEVHDLIVTHGDRYRFALTGSSARKLRRGDANLLAGRATTVGFFPFTRAELGPSFDLARAVTWGTLPQAWTDPAGATDFLESYVSTYLREEILQEAAVGRLEPFSRFLRVAAAVSGGELRVSSVARDAGVARKSAERYFDVLVDTLVGHYLPAYRPRIKVREQARPKFYFFDPGVARAAAGRLRAVPSDAEKGLLFETYLLHELRAASQAQGWGAEVSYYSGPSAEADFVVSRGDETFAVEAKWSASWRPGSGKTLKALVEKRKSRLAYGVYRGTTILKDGPVTVLPADVFLARLAEGSIWETG